MRSGNSVKALVSIMALATATPLAAQEAIPPAQPVEAPPAAVAPPPSADWRLVAPENLLIIDTTKGRVLVELAPAVAPLHVERIRLLAGLGFYDGLAWHRVIDWFMAQTGDPLGTGEGQSAYPDLPGEFTFRRGPDMDFTPVAAPMGALLGFVGSLPVQTQPAELMPRTSDGMVHGWAMYCPGVAGMARDEDPDTANSQFFLLRQAYPSLDKRYTVWGRVIVGLDVVRALKVGEEPSGMVPGEPYRMLRVRVASDLPVESRPTARVLDAGSPIFATTIESVRLQRGADFSICDLELPVQVSDPACR